MVHRLVSRHPWRQHSVQAVVPRGGTGTTSASTATSRHHFSILSNNNSSTHIRPTRVLLTASLVHAHHHTVPASVATASTTAAVAARRLFYPPSRHLRLLSTMGDSLLRKNKVDVQMLHPELHSKVFPTSTPTPTATTTTSATTSAATLNSSMEPTADMVKCAISHLKKQNLWGKEAIPVPNTTFPVPPLRGATIEDHFYNIGKLDSQVYLDLAKRFVEFPVNFSPPKEWVLQEGWTRYGNDGSVTRVDYPRDRVFTFDVETVPNLSKYPVMACALSEEAWYGWVSPWLINPVTKDGRQNDQHLLSFGPSRNNRDGDERILVGHNVGYDRARVLEEYCMEQNGMRYIDTMSLHIAGSGLCTQQRPSWLKYSKAVENGDEAYVDAFKDTTGKYFDVSAVNSLLQVSKFHCGINMDKAPRNILVEATEIGLIQENFQDLMSYCGQDVVATHRVYQQTFPKFLETCPHPVSFAGMLQMGSSFLTVNEGWTAYVKRCNKMYREMAENVESKLMLLAQNALDNFERDPEFFKGDPWLSQLDWNLPPRRWKEGKMRVDGTGWVKGQEERWICGTKLMPEKPQWFRGLWSNEEKRIKLTTRQRVAPLLLKLQWRGFPLVHSSLHGWTFQVPREHEYTTKLAELTFAPEGEAGFQEGINFADYRYYRLPHKSGEGVNVGNPLAKSYITYFEDNVLSSFAGEGGSVEDGSGKLARQALDMNAQCAYWVSARERIDDQFVVWDKGAGGLGEQMQLPERSGEDRLNGIILPQIITMGTVTRRAVEKTWMTASNAKKNRIGSELKSMVEAPAGYKIVGADVDSEELWISSLMGDAQFRMHGATALGWMTLQGTKAAGTDLHSKTAQILGISRDQAKIFNYGRIYGAGLKFAARLMQQFNTAIDAAEAKQRATNLYTATKGLKQHKAPEYELVHDRPFWHGGTESYMFNSLERTATADDPRTPALGCGITDALKPKHTETQFMTSRVNWVVQSSGVDYLHMLLVSMNYLIKKYDIQARFMLCVHDEVRYMVKEEDTARATLALQVSNLWTRAMFSYKLGIHDLPQSVAFFSSVDVDHVFRKEVNMDCLTPTQPHPIPHGQSLTIEGVLDLTNGGKLGPIAPGFQDAAEESIPFSLLSKDRQQQLLLQQSPAIQEISDSSASSLLEHSGILVKTEAQNAEERNSIFLQAQSLATMKEIKAALKSRRAEAEAAYQAQVAAERKKLKEAERLATGGGSGDDGAGGSARGGEVVKAVRRKSSTTTVPKPPSKKRVVRDPAPFSASRPKSNKGTWGMVQDSSELEADLAEEGANNAQEKKPKQDQDLVIKASQSEVEAEEEIPFVDDGIPEDGGFSTAASLTTADAGVDVATEGLLSEGDQMTVGEWWRDLGRERGGSTISLDYEPGLVFESSHLPVIPLSATNAARKAAATRKSNEPPVLMSDMDEWLSFVASSQRANASSHVSRSVRGGVSQGSGGTGKASGASRTTAMSAGNSENTTPAKTMTATTNATATTSSYKSATSSAPKAYSTTRPMLGSRASLESAFASASPSASKSTPTPAPATSPSTSTTTTTPHRPSFTPSNSGRANYATNRNQHTQFCAQQKNRAQNVDDATMRGSSAGDCRSGASFEAESTKTVLSYKDLAQGDVKEAAAARRSEANERSTTSTCSSSSSSTSSSRSASSSTHREYENGW
ncbi:MAG: DNA polymerase family A-domain-containing protein [Linnemannia gamsii]|nr:MAG: DNA polymerase family A-domain-containing protein [Linnemannia gamsii]